MTFEIIITLVSALLIGLGAIGVIYPILPGSLAVLAGILLWGLSIRGPEGWWVLGLGTLVTLLGMGAQLLLTGRTLKRESIPNKSTLWGAVGAVIGMFVIPIVGLFVGFAVGLFLSESYRRKTFSDAVPATLKALKSMGIGIVVEFGCALLTGTIFIIGVITFFVTA